MTAKEAERIAVLEARMEAFSKKQDEQARLLQEVHEALLAARGAKWAVVGMIGMSGTIGGLVSQFFPR